MATNKAASAKTPSTPLSADVDLDVAWRATISKCQSITNWDLNANSQLSVDDVVANIKPTKHDGKSESHDQAKKVFRRSLECISRFGQIAAQSASMVFGPSNQCFNAVNFVIIAAQGYAEAIGNLGVLMERISVFFDRLKNYLEDKSADVKLDPRLRVTVYRVLDHFLVVMGNAHKITSSFRGKFKLGFKVTVFGEDGGIKDALAKLETLVSDVTRAEITSIVKNLSEAAKGIRGVDKKLDTISESVEKTAVSTGHLQAAEERRSDADKEQKETIALRKALGIDDKKEPWQDRQDELSRDCIPGTGQWLLDHRYPSYPRWSDPKETSLNVLLLRGDQNFGKSFLSSIVIDDLLKKHRTNPRVCLAFYYFNADREQGDTRDSGKESVNKAMKAIIWQLAQANRDGGREFRKLAVKTCESSPELSKTDKLWELLVTEHEQSLNATFYIVLDGLEPETEPGHPLASILDRLTALTHHQPLLKTRVFITGRSASLATLTREMDQKPLEINLAPPEKEDQPALNQNDILLFAEANLNNISFYRGALESDDRDLKERVKTTLARGVRGDYFTLNSKLNEIAKARDIDKVEEILKRADEDRAQVVERQIKQLNENLSADEIEEVNHMLIWMIEGFRSPTIKLLETAMRLKDNKNKLLGPLLERIRERYSDLFFIEDFEDQESLSLVQLRSDEIESFLRRAEEQALALGRDLPRRSGGGGFQEAEVAIMERIIKAHMLHVFGEDGMGIYERYAFPDFFDSKRGPTAAQIHFHKEYAHVVMAKSCLISLCDKYDEEEFGPLHDYGFLLFADHLRVQILDTGLERVDVMAKYDIGRKLVRLLREQTFIDKWLSRWVEDKNFWVFQADLIDAVYKWLTDADVQKSLQDMPQEKKWVASLTVEGTPSIKVLSNIVLGVIRRWLNGDYPGWPSAFDFMYGYYNQLQGKQLLSDQDASVTEVEEVIAWAKAELPNEAEDSQWNFCVGVVLQFYAHLDDALQKYKSAVDMKPDHWEARQRIAITLGRKGENQDAISTLNELIERENWRLDSDKEYATEYWENILPTIVILNLRLKENTAAEDVSKRIVERIMKQDSFSETAQSDVKTLMEIQIKQRNHSELVQLLDELSGKMDLEGNWLIKMMYNFHSEDDFHNTLLDVGKNWDYLGKITELYEAAIDGAISSTSTVGKDVKASLPMRLRAQQARAILYLGTEAQRQTALSTCEELLHAAPDEEDINYRNMIWSQRIAVKHVGPALVTAALEKSSLTLEDEVASNYLQRLEALQSVDHAIGRQPVSDVRVPLARLLFLMKQTERARKVIRDYVAVAVQLLEESAGDNMEACDRLVNAFLALEDDVNATAAFTLFNRKAMVDELDDAPFSASEKSPATDASKTVSPGEGTQTLNGGEHANAGVNQTLNEEKNQDLEIPKTDEPETITTTVETEFTNGTVLAEDASVVNNEQQIEKTNTIKTTGTEVPRPTTAKRASNGNEDAEAGASPECNEQRNVENATTPISRSSLPLLTKIDTSVSPEASAKDESAAPQSPVPNWTSNCSAIACENTWDYPCDMYGCRDCYKIICPSCYQELRSGTDTKISCHKLHSHLHIPPVDVQHFIDRPKDIVWVGGAEVPLQQWLDSIKNDWGLEQRSVKARERWMTAVRRVSNSLALKPDRHDSTASNN